MGSKLRQTALTYLEGFQTLSSDSFLAILAPNAIQRFAPASCSPPPPMTPIAFANHIKHLREVLLGFPVFANEIFVNEEKSQVTIWATSETQFRDECKDGDTPAAEWLYRGEYIFILTTDPSHEKIVEIIEFVDSKGTERLRDLMSRARRNLERVRK